VKGYDHDKVRNIAQEVANVVSAHPNIKNVSLNRNEKSKVIHLSIDQDKARKLGITSQALATSIQTQLSDAPIAQFRENDKTINMVFRFDAQDREDPSHMKDLNIHIGNGKYVPLDQIAKINLEAEEGLIYRLDLKPVILVQAETIPEVTGDSVTKQLADLRTSLPLGYSIEYDGANENSIKAVKYLSEPIPAMIIVIMIPLMTQLQSIPKMLLTLLTAPLGIIGVAIGLLFTSKPMGFLVQIGVLALAGIIMRNSVILMGQIDQQLAGRHALGRHHCRYRHPASSHPADSGSGDFRRAPPVPQYSLGSNGAVHRRRALRRDDNDPVSFACYVCFLV
jgi:multidrug efflux pump subunit AcrB